MKKRLAVCLFISMIAALIVPSTAYSAKPDSPAFLNGFEIVKKMPAKGINLMGPPSMGPKPQSATGIIGAQVTGNRYAIVIGISDYPGSDMDIFYADDDAYAVSTVLTRYGFEICTLVDKDASRAAILDQIAALKSTVSKDDEVFFYFSGHGAKPSAGTGGGKVGIVTWGYEDENTAYPEVIWDGELKDAFSEFATDRIIFGFDCCLSGGFIEIGSKGGIICMATTQNGIAAEYGEAYGPKIPGFPYNSGFFTYYFVTLGLAYGQADFCPPDGIVTIEESFDFTGGTLAMISDMIPELHQIPTIKDNFKGDLIP